MSPCAYCRGAGCVPVYHRTGSAPCPECQPEASAFGAIRARDLGEGAAILVGADGAAEVIADPAAVLVAGVRVSRSRIDDLYLVIAACDAHGIAPIDWLTQARAALGVS